MSWKGDQGQTQDISTVTESRLLAMPLTLGSPPEAHVTPTWLRFPELPPKTPSFLSTWV